MMITLNVSIPTVITIFYRLKPFHTITTTTYTAEYSNNEDKDKDNRYNKDKDNRHNILVFKLATI